MSENPTGKFYISIKNTHVEMHREMIVISPPELERLIQERLVFSGDVIRFSFWPRASSGALMI